MPEDDYRWLSRDRILSFAEINQLVDAFTDAGVDKIRLTGGEPLLRPDLQVLVKTLAQKPQLREIALTTNGILLAKQADGLCAAGLGRVTVSLDTLRPNRFVKLARRHSHAAVLAGIQRAVDCGFKRVKINMLVMRGVNDDELVDLIDFGRDIGAEVRFIEYMDVGGATGWTPELVVSRAEIIARLTERFGAVTEMPRSGATPADRFLLPDGTAFGVISSTTQPFCGSCDRGRLTADGQWYSCLYTAIGTDLRTPLRAAASRSELADRIAGLWSRRSDQGAVERLAHRDDVGLIDREQLQRDPHLEMHTRGG